MVAEPLTQSGAGPSDAVLVVAARAGESWARESLFRRYRQMVYGLSLRLTGGTVAQYNFITPNLCQAGQYGMATDLAWYSATRKHACLSRARLHPIRRGRAAPDWRAYCRSPVDEVQASLRVLPTVSYVLARDGLA